MLLSKNNYISFMLKFQTILVLNRIEIMAVSRMKTTFVNPALRSFKRGRIDGHLFNEK